MKASAAQLGQAIDRVGQGGTVRLFLLHGPDEAGAMAQAERLARAMGADAERIDLDGATLRADPARLADEAASLSLFGGRRWVRVTGTGEEALTAVQGLIDAASAGNPVMAIAPGIKASGKLVKLVLASPEAMAFACYAPEGQDAARIAAGIAREHGLRLLGDTAATMAEAAGGDRAVLAREIEKLALFLDAAPDRPREADADTVAAIAANLDETGIAAAVEAAIDGQPALLGPELMGLASANMEIPLLRAIARRLIALADMRGEIDAGAGAETVIERHRVFWKEKSSTIKALRRWNGEQITAALARVRAAERAMLSGGGTGPLVAGHAAMALARSAARR